MIFNNYFILVVLLIVKINADERPSCIFEGCQCRNDANNDLQIECIASNSQSTFPVRLQAHLKQNISLFLFHGFDVPQIADNFFANLSIKFIHLISVRLENITANSFSGIENLQEIVLYQSSIENIHENALEAVNDTVRKLEIVNCNLTSQKYESYLPSIRRLTFLKILNLADNQLEEPGLDWFKTFRQIKEIYLNRNRIKKLSDNVFKSNVFLRVVDLSENGLDTVPGAFTQHSKFSYRFSLQILKLNKNSIVHLPDFSDLEDLSELDLSSNQIEEITTTSFKNLTNIRKLNLENNRIHFIDYDSFVFNSRLKELFLSNNFINKIPDLTNLYDLNTLNMENQNGKLNSLEDYVFDTTNNENRRQNMVVYLRKNELKSFSNKTFCWRQTTGIQYPTVDIIYMEFESIRNLDKCIMKQLKSSFEQFPTNVVIDDSDLNLFTNISEYRSVCNCERIQFAKNYSINFVGICSFFKLDCKGVSFIDDCNKRPEFEC